MRHENERNEVADAEQPVSQEPKPQAPLPTPPPKRDGETPAEKKERLRLTRAWREQRNERMFRMNCRGVTFDELATTFKLSVTAVHKIIKAKAKAVRDSGQEDIDLIRTQQLQVISTLKQGWTNRAVLEAAEASDSNNALPEGKAIARVMQLFEREARLLSLDSIQVKGDPDQPIKIQGDTAQLLQEFLKMALAAVKPFPGAGEAILQAMLGEGEQAAESA